MSAKEIITATPTGHPRQFEVRNNFNDLPGEWEVTYVNFGGYFGKHGPHVFAAAPDLLEALELILKTTSRELFATNALKKARQALTKAKGAA